MDLDMVESIKQRLNISDMSKPVLVGIVVILVMVAVAAGRLLIGTATASEFEIVKGQEATQAEEREDVPSSQPETIFVHVSGEVVRPGLVEVDEGARVADAVQAAGGFTQEAATGSVNLARVLSDGEQIVIARMAEEGDVPVAAASGSAAVASTAAASSSPSGGLVNINTAPEAELVSLPGIGEATAAKIVADRQASGAFKTIEDLKRVSGIGDKKFEALSGLICV